MAVVPPNRALNELRDAIRRCVEAGIEAPAIQIEAERLLIQTLMGQKRRPGSIQATAHDLGVHRNTLARRMQLLGMYALKPGQSRSRVA